MKKYWTFIPIVIYPYLYLILLLIYTAIAMILAKFNAENAILEYGGLFLLLFGILYNIFALVMAIVNSVIVARGRKYDLRTAAKINMLVKCILIPSYIFHFIVGFFSFLASVWGIGLLIFVIAIDFITILLSGISGIGLAIFSYKEGMLSRGKAVLLGIFNFVYVIDVILAIVYFFEVKNMKRVYE